MTATTQQPPPDAQPGGQHDGPTGGPTGAPPREVGDDHPRGRPARSGGAVALVVVGLVTAAVLVLTSALGVVSGLAREDLASSVSLAGVDAAAVDLRCPGGLDAVTDPSMAPGTAEVSWDERWWRTAPTRTADVTGGRLHVSTACRSVVIGSATRSDVVVRLAPGTALAVDSSLGDVVVRQADADVTVVSDVGDVSVGAASAPDRVRVRAGAGDVSVDLPAQARYDVTARSGAGERRVDVEQDAGSTHRVDVSTGVGDVTVRPLS